MVTNYIWFIVSLILCSWAQEAEDGCFSSALIGRYCRDRNQIGSDSDHREITQTECQSRCTTDPTCGGINYYPSRNGGDCRLFTNTNCETSYSRWNDAIHQMRESCPSHFARTGDHVCYEVSTSGWNCANGMSIDGTYLVVETINNKQAWRKADGVYLRWASMWSQWIFDDDTEDTTSIAWNPNTGSIQDALEVETPPTGTTSPKVGSNNCCGFRYGGTCGNNRDVVSSLTITETTCPEYIKLASLDGFCGSTNLGRPNVESVYPSTAGSVGFLEYQNALGVEGCSHNLDDWFGNYKQCGGACYAVCEDLGKLECDRLGDQCAGFRIHGYYGTTLFAPDFENCMSLHPTSNFGDDGFRITGGWNFYYKPSTHEEMVALNTPKPSTEFYPLAGSATCEASLDDWCASNTPYKYARFDRSRTSETKQWRCYSTGALTADTFHANAEALPGTSCTSGMSGGTLHPLDATCWGHWTRESQLSSVLESCSPADRRRLKVKQQSRLRRLLNLISDLE